MHGITLKEIRLRWRASVRRTAWLQGVWLALIFALSFAGQANAAGANTLAVVRARGAELYAAPGDATALRALASSARLEAVGRTADSTWIMVKTPDGATGWVNQGQVVIFAVTNLPVRGDAPPASTRSLAPINQATGIVNTAGDLLNLRSGPGTGYPIIGATPPGVTLTLVGRDTTTSWLQITQPGGADIAWVSATFVRVEGDAARLPVSERLSQTPADASAGTPAAASAGAPAAQTSAALPGKLIFQTASNGTIYRYDFATGQLQPLTTGADPALSPDGQTVAFWRQDGGQYGLYLVDVTGGAERRILTRAEKLRTPTFSPDGRALAFSHVNGQDACRDAGYGICLPDVFPYNRLLPLVLADRWNLAAVARDGGSYRDIPALSGAASPDWGVRGLIYAAGGIQVTRDGGGADANVRVLSEGRFRDPAWQPNGDRIIFQSLEKDHWEIFTAGADGAGVTALTRPATTLVPKLPQNVAPVWSPDGRYIAFLSDRDGAWRIWVMDADGSHQRPLPIETPLEYRNQGEQMLSWGQ